MNEQKLDDLARDLAVRAQKELYDEELFVNVDYLQSYFDEAIHNAIERQKNK